MKYFMALTATIAFLFCQVCDLKAQWVKTNGPCGSSGTVYSIAIDSTHIFATGGMGVYLSTDKGNSWSLVYTDSTNSIPPGANGVVSLLMNGHYIYAGTNSRGIFRSTNNGSSWSQNNVSTFSSEPIVAMAISGSVMHASAYWGGGGTYRSTDNGVNWIMSDPGLQYVTCFAVQGSIIFAAVHGDRYTPGGVYLSADNGAHWQSTSLRGHINSVAVKGATIFACADTCVFRSTDNGAIWNAANLGVSQVFVNTVIISPSGSHIFVGTNRGVFCSTDFGETWTAVNMGLTSKCIYSLAQFPAGSDDSSYVYAGTNGGIFRSTDNGVKWTASGLPNDLNLGYSTNGSSLASTGSILLAGSGYTKSSSSDKHGNNYGLFGNYIGSVLFLSTDNGSTWTEADSGLAGANTRLTSLAVNGPNIFAGTNPGGVFLSTNNGTSWTTANSGMNNTKVLAVASNSSYIFAGTNGGGVNRSYNDGLNWGIVNNGLPDTIINTFAVSESNIYVGSTSFKYISRPFGSIAISINDIYYSSDNGTNWARIDSQVTYNFRNICLAANGSNLVVGTGYNSASYVSQFNPNGGIYRITFDGIKWNVIDSALIGYYVTSLTSTGSNFFAGTMNGGVFASSNNGASWASINSGLADSNVASLVIHNSNLFAATSSGVWRRQLSEITSVQSADGIFPKNYCLEQNYPNPFNPSTTICYQLPNACHVMLKVYDILGREVATLVDELKEVGSYSVTFSGEKLSSGVYIARLTAQSKDGKSFVHIKKMLMLK
jgi:photosystem II stability/assembly factor-like uncharacterized protein